MSKRIPKQCIEPENRRKRKRDEQTRKQPEDEVTEVEKWTPRPLIKKMQGKTADDAVKEMGGDVSPLVRQGLDMIYGTEIRKELNSRIEAANKRIEADNIFLAEMRKGIDELSENNKRIQREVHHLRESTDRMLRSGYW